MSRDGLQVPGDYRMDQGQKEDIPLVKNAGLRETGILTSVSDYHIFLKLGLTRKKALDAYLGIVKSILDAGIIPRCHFEDITRADVYGFCVPFAIELMKLREESGIDIKIRLCDTLGNGISYSQAALPRSVPKLVRAFIDDAGVPGQLLEWHGHNDFHKAHINAATAWLYGCSGANGTLLGIGERTGNTAIEGLIMEYIGLRGNESEIDTTIITEIADYCEGEIGIKIPNNMPFVRGRSITEEDVAVVRKIITAHPDGSRRFISQEVCRAWDWRQPNGILKDQVCRTLLLLLESKGFIKQPPPKCILPNPLANRKNPLG